MAQLGKREEKKTREQIMKDKTKFDRSQAKIYKTLL